jgi:hypothetical protein
MKLAKSAKERARQAALKKQQEEQLAYKLRQEAISIRINLVKINPEFAKLSWKFISEIPYPESTYHVQAYYLLLKDAKKMPEQTEVLELVNFFKSGE